MCALLQRNIVCHIKDTFTYHEDRSLNLITVYPEWQQGFLFAPSVNQFILNVNQKLQTFLGSILVLMQFYRSLNSTHYIREKYHRDCFDALENRTTTSNNKKIKKQTTYRVIDTKKAIGCY